MENPSKGKICWALWMIMEIYRVCGIVTWRLTGCGIAERRRCLRY